MRRPLERAAAIPAGSEAMEQVSNLMQRCAGNRSVIVRYVAVICTVALIATAVTLGVRLGRARTGQADPTSSAAPSTAQDTTEPSFEPTTTPATPTTPSTTTPKPSRELTARWIARSGTDQRHYTGSVMDPILSRCSLNDTLNSTMVTLNTTMDYITYDDVDYIAGCSYRFVMNASATRARAEGLCRHWGAELAIIEGYEEQCYIAHKIGAIREAGAALEIDKVWISGYVAQSADDERAKFVETRWSDGTAVGADGAFDHPCVHNEYSVGLGLALDLATYPQDSFEYSCWATIPATATHDLLCKRC